MKRQMLTFAAVLATLLVSGSAYAQTIKIQANVPFNFVVSGKTMPAGSYLIQSVGAQDGKTLRLSSDDKKEAAVINANSAQSLTPADRTKLVFHRYGDRYFLSQVWRAGENIGHQLPKSPRESEVAMDYPVQTVVLMAEAR
jgi:hypothetical protein